MSPRMTKANLNGRATRVSQIKGKVWMLHSFLLFLPSHCFEFDAVANTVNVITVQ